MKSKPYLSIICCLLGVLANAQQPKLLFKKGDRVCFVGNSITHNGEFHHHIMQYYVTRFPKQPVHFFNAGVKGDVTGGILQRMDGDILKHKPTHAVIMIGMNDVQRHLYHNAVVHHADHTGDAQKGTGTIHYKPGQHHQCFLCGRAYK